MPTPLPDRDCLDCTPDEMALAERLGRESLEHIADRMLLGTTLLISVRIEADYDDKVQLHAIQVAFDVLRHWNPNEPS